MPKSKTKKKSRGLPQGSPEPKALNMAPQAVAHRRGGTHQVREQDRTDSIYDTYNYKDLLDTAKERGIYRKDMKKVEMAWALKHNDEEKKRAEHDTLIALHRKVHEQKKEEAKKEAERQKLIIAKLKRRIEKEKRRARDESVSDDTMSGAEMEAREVARDEYKRENVGQALSDESWDSTSTESSTHSLDGPIEHDCKLRLFEWPYEYMPLAHEYVQQPGTFWVPEQLPWQITYAPLKIVTTVSKQKLFLPGLKYPTGVDPDFVPILDAETRSAARNGHLTGVLRKAVIEKGTHWAQRTLIQGWNGRMYFNLGSRNDTKDLASTYQKWTLENRRLLRVKGEGGGVPADRERRHLQRYKNKARETAEVYESCQYRPLAMCYLPAYLDFSYSEEEEEEEEERTLENLFFIRFPGCDVPHYYFWVREGHWSDPTTRNNAWNPAEMDKPRHALLHDSNDRPRLGHKYPQKSWKPPVKMWVRVKKHDVQLQPPTPVSATSNTLDTMERIEHALHSHGLAATLIHYCTKWLSSGKQLAWESFARDLPALYPSGQLPEVPPVESSEGARVAVKLAMIESLDPDAETCLSPLRGEEGWTRDDDALWDVVEVDGPTLFSPNARRPEHQYGFEGFVEIGTAEEEEEEEDEFEDVISRDVEAEALYRRGSLAFNFPHGKEDVLEKWLEGLSPKDVPPAWVEEVSGEGESENVEEVGECPFCEERWEGMGTEEQAAHMLFHSTTGSRARRRSSTSQYPLVALPPTARRPRCRLPQIRTNVPRLSIDLGVEGDVDTPRKPNFIQNPTGALRLKTKINPGASLKKLAKRQRRRLPTDHPEGPYNPRKRSCSTIDSFELLGIHGASRPAKRRQTAMPKVKLLPREPGEIDEGVSPVRLLMLERRKSKTNDPSYKPSKESGRPNKKRKIEDPTYRNTLASSKSDGDGMHHPISESQHISSNPYQGILPSPVLSDRKLPPLKARKRKGVRDETYKGDAVIFASSDDGATPSPPRPALKKRKKTIDPTYRDLSRLNLLSSEESEVEVRPVRKVNRKVKKVRIVKKVVRFMEEPEVIPDLGSKFWREQDRRRKAEWLDMNDGVGEGVQNSGGWGWCAVM